jgi:hypothetical protein
MSLGSNDDSCMTPVLSGNLASAGGIVKAAGLGDGLTRSRESHRQASLDDATRITALFCEELNWNQYDPTIRPPVAISGRMDDF